MYVHCQEVVVTGYTSQRRKDLTGSVGVVETAKLTAVPTGNVSNIIAGTYLWCYCNR